MMYNLYEDIAISPNGSASICYDIRGSFIGFRKLRIYSVCRSSLNTTPLVKVVVDISSDKDDIYSTAFDFQFVDNNTVGYTIDPIELYSIGGNPIASESFIVKDNTLFFGNIKNKILSID